MHMQSLVDVIQWPDQTPAGPEIFSFILNKKIDVFLIKQIKLAFRFQFQAVMVP